MTLPIHTIFNLIEFKRGSAHHEFKLYQLIFTLSRPRDSIASSPLPIHGRCDALPLELQAALQEKILTWKQTTSFFTLQILHLPLHFISLMFVVIFYQRVGKMYLVTKTGRVVFPTENHVEAKNSNWKSNFVTRVRPPYKHRTDLSATWV